MTRFDETSRTASTAPRGGDTLEDELRAVLREDAPAGAPASLRSRAARIPHEPDAVTGRSPGRAPLLSFARGLAAVAVAAALLLAAILTVPRLTGPQPAVLPPSPVASSHAPAPSASGGATTEPTATPHPSVSPSPSAPALVPGIRGPVHVAGASATVGPDGTLYVASAPWGKNGQAELTAVDASANVKPGWPFRPAGIAAFDAPAVASDGTVYVVGHEWGTGVRIYALSPDGEGLPGWPWQPASTGETPQAVAVGPDGTVWVGVWRPGGSGSGPSAQLVALDARARLRPGFPIELSGVPGCGGVSCSVDRGEVGPDGTWYGLVSLVAGAAGEAFEIVAYRPDGSTVPGWPVRVPGEGFTLGANGVLYAWGVATNGVVPPKGQTVIERTIFEAFDPDGSARPGWPVTVEGPSSPPLIAPDGTLYTTAGTWETTERVLAYGPDAKPLPGWPVTVPSGLQAWPYYVGEGGPARLSAPLAVGPSGTVYLVLRQPTAPFTEGLLAIDHSGSVREPPAWFPNGATVASLGGPATPGTSALVTPVAGPDGTLQLATMAGFLVVDAAGRTIDDRSGLLDVPGGPRTSVVLDLLPGRSGTAYLVTSDAVYTITR